jgi:hypothetical protein
MLFQIAKVSRETSIHRRKEKSDFFVRLKGNLVVLKFLLIQARLENSFENKWPIREN